MEIDKDSSRMGLRLKTINLYHKIERKQSIGVDEGIIQLPKNGLPIILMADGQITGGYPIIGFIPKYGLSLLSQINIGQKFKFELISLEKAKKNNIKMLRGINKFKKNYNLKYANS
jgi:allophanate hydrolase subunit 2